MRIQSYSLFVGTLVFCLGCTKGVPSFETLDESSVPQPLFSGSSSTTILVSSASVPISVSGTCDSKITELIATPVGVASPQPLSSYATGVSVLCTSAGTFSFSLNSLNAMGFTITDNTIFDLQLRGVTNAGLSRASVIHLSLSLVGKPERLFITSGSTESLAGAPRRALSGSFQAEIRLGHFSNKAPATNEALLKTSTSYVFKSGTAATND